MTLLRSYGIEIDPKSELQSALFEMMDLEAKRAGLSAVAGGSDKRWTFACKVPNGDSPISAFELIKGAIEQINRSDAERGLVVLNARNWVNHDRLWAPPHNDRHRVWPDDSGPRKLLVEESDRREKAVVEVKGAELNDLFNSANKVVPVVAVFLQSTVVVQSAHGPLMSRIYQLATWPFGSGTLKPDDQAILREVNEAVNGFPEVPGLESSPSPAPVQPPSK